MRSLILAATLLAATPAAAQIYWVTPVTVPTTSFYVAPGAAAKSDSTPTAYYLPATTSYYVPSTSYYVPSTSYYLPSTSTSYYVPAASATPAYYVPSAPVSYYVPAAPATATPAAPQKVERYYYYGNSPSKQAPAQRASANGETIVREYHYYSSEDPKPRDSMPSNSTGVSPPNANPPERLVTPPPEDVLDKREGSPNATDLPATSPERTASET